MINSSEFLRKLLSDREQLLLHLTEDYSHSLMKQKEYCAQLESVPILEMKIKKMANSYFKNMNQIVSQYAIDMKVLSYQLNSLVNSLSTLINCTEKRQVFNSLVDIEEGFLVLNQLVIRHEKLLNKIQMMSMDKQVSEYHKIKMSVQAQIAQDRYISVELEK